MPHSVMQSNESISCNRQVNQVNNSAAPSVGHKSRSFRVTLLTLVMLAVSLPLLLLGIYQIHYDRDLRAARLQQNLVTNAHQAGLILTQELQSLLTQIDLLGQEIALQADSPEAFFVARQKMQRLVARNNAVASLWLLDENFSLRDAVPASAVYSQLQSFLPSSRIISNQQIADGDPRTRITLMHTHEAAPVLMLTRPVLQRTGNPAQPFSLRGLLLIHLDAESLIHALADQLVDHQERARTQPHRVQLDLTQAGQALVTSPAAGSYDFSTAVEIRLAHALSQPLTLKLHAQAQITWWEVLRDYLNLMLLGSVMLLFIVWLTKRITYRLVSPITQLSAIAQRLEKSDFTHKIMDIQSIRSMRFQEFTELFRLLDTMESAMVQEFGQLQRDNLTLEEKVLERTNELIENVSLLDEQRRALQQLVRYSIDLQQVDTIEEAGTLTLDIIERTTRCNAGLHLVRKEYVSGFTHFEHLNTQTLAHLDSQRAHFSDINFIEQLSHALPQLQILTIGSTYLDYYGFALIERSDSPAHAGDALVMLNTLISSAIRQYNFTNHLHWLAHIDAVTKIANRHYYSERLEQKVKEFQLNQAHSHFAIFIIDANGLKQINDKYGHSSGDQMLTVIASALKNTVRAQDTLARVGGDEFCVILDRADRAACDTFAERLHHLRQSLSLTLVGEQLPLSFSFGYACTQEDSLKNLTLLADERMYQDKKMFYNRKSLALPPTETLRSDS